MPCDDCLYVLVTRGDDVAVRATLQASNREDTETCISYRDEENGGITALIAASFQGDIAIVSQLIEAGADVSEVDYEGQTALCGAADYGSSALCTLLLDSAQAEGLMIIDGHPSCLHETPLGIAASLGHEDAVCILIAAGADVNGARLSPSPLCLACRARSLSCCQLLLDAGADHNQVLSLMSDEISIPHSYAGWGPLHIAAHLGLIEVLRLLLDRGADVTMRTKKTNKTSYQLAKDVSCRQILKAYMKGAETKPSNSKIKADSAGSTHGSTPHPPQRYSATADPSCLRPAIKQDFRGATRRQSEKVVRFNEEVDRR